MALRQDDTGATFRAGNPTGKRQHTVDYYDVLRSFPVINKSRLSSFGLRRGGTKQFSAVVHIQKSLTLQ